MLNCREATVLCSAEMERSLHLREQMSLGAHLLMCSGCTNYRKQMKTLRQVMQAYAAGHAATSAPDDAGPTPSDGGDA
jgi:predicted anti-sigma-YlaC factor YlaD